MRIYVLLWAPVNSSDPSLYQLHLRFNTGRIGFASTIGRHPCMLPNGGITKTLLVPNPMVFFKLKGAVAVAGGSATILLLRIITTIECRFREPCTSLRLLFLVYVKLFFIWFLLMSFSVTEVLTAWPRKTLTSSSLTPPLDPLTPTRLKLWISVVNAPWSSEVRRYTLNGRVHIWVIPCVRHHAFYPT